MWRLSAHVTCCVRKNALHVRIIVTTETLISLVFASQIATRQMVVAPANMVERLPYKKTACATASTLWPGLQCSVQSLPD